MRGNKKPKTENIEKDLQTCFIIAGYTGAGKSTIVRSSHELEIRLFGEEFHQQFRDTSRSPFHEENDNYSEAIKTSANFQGKHVHKLAKEEHPPKNILIQLDLKHVVHRLGHSAATKKAQKEIEKLTNIHTPRSKKSDPKICDLMMSSYLKNPFFQRFKFIVVSTVYTNFEENYKQYASRKTRKGSTARFEDADKQETERNTHSAMYEAWKNNLHLLKPKKHFITTVNNHGDLISNNQCICANCTHKAGIA